MAFYQYFLPVVKVNLVNAVILVPILLFNYERIDLAAPDWLRSGLMRRFAAAILVSAALPVALLGLFLTQQSTGLKADPGELTLKLGLTILLTLLFTLINAGLLAQSLSRPLLRLTEAARLMEAGTLSRAEAADLQSQEPNDEIGYLSNVFGRMAQEVILREETLRLEVQQLQIEIDQARRARQVAEITETDYFQELQRKAEQLRRRRRS